MDGGAERGVLTAYKGGVVSAHWPGGLCGGLRISLKPEGGREVRAQTIRPGSEAKADYTR